MLESQVVVRGSGQGVNILRFVLLLCMHYLPLRHFCRHENHTVTEDFVPQYGHIITQLRTEQARCQHLLADMPTNCEIYKRMNSFPKEDLNAEICHFRIPLVSFVVSILYACVLGVCKWRRTFIHDGKITFYELTVSSISY